MKNAENQSDKIKENEDLKQPEKHKIITSLSGSLHKFSADLNETLKESDDEILEQKKQEKIFLDTDSTDIKNDSEITENNSEKAKNRVAMIGAAVITIFAVIGFVFSIMTIVDFVKPHFYKNKVKKQLFEHIFPLALNDPPQFDDVSEIPSVVAVSSSIWRVLLYYDLSRYDAKTLPGYIIIPADDVRKSSKEIFGYNYELDTTATNFSFVAFEFDSEQNRYIIPESGESITFTPEITSYTESQENGEKVYSATVSYFTMSPYEIVAVNDKGKNYKPKPEKMLVYKVAEKAGRFTVVSAVLTENFG